MGCTRIRIGFITKMQVSSDIGKHNQISYTGIIPINVFSRNILFPPNRHIRNLFQDIVSGLGITILRIKSKVGTPSKNIIETVTWQIVIQIDIFLRRISSHSVIGQNYKIYFIENIQFASLIKRNGSIHDPAPLLSLKFPKSQAYRYDRSHPALRYTT